MQKGKLAFMEDPFYSPWGAGQGFVGVEPGTSGQLSAVEAPTVDSDSDNQLYGVKHAWPLCDAKQWCFSLLDANLYNSYLVGVGEYSLAQLPSPLDASIVSGGEVDCLAFPWVEPWSGVCEVEEEPAL